MAKLVSQLDSEGYFLCMVEADDSPLDPGAHILPGGSVDIAGPKRMAKGVRYRLIGAKWVAEPLAMAPTLEQSAAPPNPIMSARQFLRKFTREEYGAARASEHTDIQWAIDSIIAAQFVDLTDPEIAAGLDLMVQAGVLTQARRDDLVRIE